MSDGNPYFGLLEVIKRNARSVDSNSFLIGKVKSTNPLSFDAGEIPLTRSDVLISDYLLAGEGLKVNERVLILVSADRQMYIILSRVV